MRSVRGRALVIAVVAWPCLGAAQARPAPGAAAGPTEDQLADTVRLGSIAALAPICGLRDQRWAEDLRRAAIRSATRAKAPDDPALKAAPGSDLAASALSFAEAEALESFAEAPAAQTCTPLALSPDLDQADRAVSEFRAATGALGRGS